MGVHHPLRIGTASAGGGCRHRHAADRDRTGTLKPGAAGTDRRTMALLRPRTPALHDPISVRSERDRRKAIRVLGRALTALERRAGRPDVDVLEIQLVAQVVRAEAFGVIHAGGKTRTVEEVRLMLRSRAA